MDTRLIKVETRLKTVELKMENDISTRLCNIESCYLDTYKRYQAGSEQIEGLQADVDVMKSVLIEHSTKIQKIS